MSALAFLVNIIFDAYILILLIRFLLEIHGSSYYNPFIQFIVKVTEPVAKYIRKLLPKIKEYDLALLVLAWIIEIAENYLMMLLQFQLVPGIISALLLGVAVLCVKVIDIFFWTTIMAVILSWIPNLQSHPVAEVIKALAAPVLNLGKRFIPPISGIDFSPLVVLLVLKMITLFVISPFINFAMGIA